MELWHIFLGIGAVLTPFILAAMARDRALLTMISTVKDDTSQQIKAATDPVHERINRVRDEFVRRDDLEGHLGRWDRQFEDLRTEMRRNSDFVGEQLREIMNRLPPR
jgi:hypothetical protein